MKFHAKCHFTLVSFLFSSFLFISFFVCISRAAIVHLNRFRISKWSIVLKTHIKCAQVYLLDFVCEIAKYNFAQVVFPRECDFFYLIFRWRQMNTTEKKIERHFSRTMVIILLSKHAIPISRFNQKILFKQMAFICLFHSCIFFFLWFSREKEFFIHEK